MKTLIAALAALLAVASLPAVSAEAEKVGVEAQQKYMLPIGSNVNNRPAKVGMSIGNWDTGWVISDEFDYTPTMGGLEQVIKYRLRKLTDGFSPPLGSERDSYSLGVIVEPGPYTVVRFQLDQGKIPPEVLDVKLQYGTAVAWWVPGVTASTMQVVDASGTRTFSSADGNGYDDSPCFLGASRAGFQSGAAGVQVEYALPEFQKERGITAGSVTLWQNERYVSFDLLDGHFIRVSAEPPDFLESLRAPEIQSASQAPVLVISTPRISRIVRVGHTTEIMVSAESNISAHLEFATAIGGIWNAIPAYPVPLSLKAGSTQFTHTIESPTAFYRLRVVDSPKGQ